jgi:hypothetical protein
MEENKLFKPFVPDESKMAEFTIKSILLGSIFGIIFGFVYKEVSSYLKSSKK